MDPAKSCLTCKKANNYTYRWYAFGSREEIVTYECVCTDQWLMHLWMINAGIGLAYQRLAWDDMQDVADPAIEQIMRYATDGKINVAEGRNLVLWSKDAGTGKTGLATLLGKSLLLQGIDVFFAQFNEIIDMYTGGWRNDHERRFFERRVRNVDVLVMDDIGKEHKGRIEMVEAMVDSIIRSRVQDSLPTIITTNLTPEQIRENYGGYVTSLLSERADFIHIPGADFRIKANQRSLQEREQGLTRPITVV